MWKITKIRDPWIISSLICIKPRFFCYSFEIIEKSISVAELKKADSAFFCGTAAEVIGIESLDDYKFPLNWKDSKGAIIQRNYMNLVLHKELELA